VRPKSEEVLDEISKGTNSITSKESGDNLEVRMLISHVRELGDPDLL
jgi:hypothetical protein